ncbi:beta-mannosidase-like [Glandiceps talaboti]
MEFVLELLVLVFTFSHQFYCTTAGTLSLNGKWTITNGSLTVDGAVPGSVHTALLDANKIKDPYYRFNDEAYRWIAWDDWTYTRTFTVSKDITSKSSVVLVTEGVDTIATVKVNGNVVGKTTNMFVKYVMDIKSAIKERENTISVAFQSALQYANQTNTAHSEYEVPPSCPPPVQHGECHPNFIRKQQCSFSWDWGPAFAPMGIWKNILIEAWDCATLRDVSALAMKSQSNPKLWVVNVTGYIDVANNEKVQGKAVDLMVSIPQLQTEHGISFIVTPGKREAMTVVVNAAKAETWWPNGYGKQPLYDVIVSLECPIFQEKFSKEFQVGFRTVELVQDPLPEKNATGLSFYFKINNQPIFIKGSNWIPADAFQERISKDQLTNLLHSTADAHMNTLRVWGGGIYEQEEFYNIADQLGIMIWQDFMFACALYPTNDDFLKSVKQEITHQVKRLSHHPSILVWSGNNENEGALANGWYEGVVSKNKSLYYEDYRTLYIDTIMSELESLDITRPFIPSSPTNGIETRKEDWIAKQPQDTQYGDVHFYDYTSDCWDVGIYPKPRFASEYGYQSWPSFETIQKVSLEEDWNYYGNFSSYRNHHPLGNTEMSMLAAYHYTLPKTSNVTQKFIDMIYLTQIVQAMCIKTETEYYRSLQSNLDVKGQGHTMGALYWQLNDIWQAPTWASIEYGGKWKMLHYYAVKFFSPVLVMAYVSGGTLNVYGISDLTADTVNVTATRTLWQWSQFQPLHSTSTTYTQTTQSSILVYNGSLSEELHNGKCTDKTKCFMTFDLLANGQPLCPTNVLYLTGFNKAVGIQKVNVTITDVTQEGDKIFNIVLKTNHFAIFTWLEATGIEGRFSDNGFLMTAPSMKIRFYAWQKTTVSDLKKALTVKVYNNM